ncbi:MAG: cupin domain-containing protein [Weeksellaceae bacterium]
MKIIRNSDIEYQPASHEDPQDPGVLKKVLLRGTDFIKGEIQMINWSKLPVGKAFAQHYHESLQEVFVMLSGTARITVEHESAHLEKGDAVVIEPNEKHVMQNTSQEDVYYIALGIASDTNGKTVVV